MNKASFQIGAVGVTAIGMLAAGLLAGCDKNRGRAAKLAVPGNGDAAQTKPYQAAQEPVLSRARLHQSFKEATIQEPPDGQWLPDVTKTAKSVGRLYEAVIAEWSNVPFLTADDKPLVYTATIATGFGDIVIELWPQVAPNHVRNFIALARAGYFDGLAFDRAVKRQDSSGAVYESLEAGCPVGMGDSNYGSIGYWMKPELTKSRAREPGSIGAWHGPEVESAACKFYITLSNAEWMDSNFTLFGKVTKGLEVLQAIHRRPVRKDGFQDRPIEPVIMRTVVIASTVR